MIFNRYINNFSNNFAQIFTDFPRPLTIINNLRAAEQYYRLAGRLISNHPRKCEPEFETATLLSYERDGYTIAQLQSETHLVESVSLRRTDLKPFVVTWHKRKGH